MNKKNNTFAIIAVGYNRPDAMMRLLNSLCKAYYDENDDVDLIISIDKGERQKEIIEKVNTIEWEHGDKIVRDFAERQGLRRHILQCGDFTNEYKAVVVLEDDITVSKGYFFYVKQMISTYGNDENIAGISLYSYEVSPYSGRMFCPVKNRYDVYAMQVAMSWGQCWNARMWKGFMLWYEKHSNGIPYDEKLPYSVVKWSNKSWLKFYDRYLVENNKYYIMPYISLSTNNAESGEHNKSQDTSYQVPLLEDVMNYRTGDFTELIKYDAFFERLGIEDQVFPEFKGKKMLDLNGSRTKYGDADILVSTRQLPYRVIKKAMLNYRPQEINVINPENGEGIYFYDLNDKTRSQGKKELYYIAKYDFRKASWHLSMRHAKVELLRGIREKLARK